MQSKRWYSCALPKFFERLNQYSSKGCRSAGQAFEHSVQRMQGCSGGAGERQQVLDRGADQHLPVAGVVDVAGERDDAADQRLAMRKRAIHRVRRADVEALHAVVAAELAVGDLDAGEHADELLLAAGRIQRWHRHHLDAVRGGGRGLLHGRDRLGLVVLDADHQFARADQAQQDACARQDAFGTLAHQAIVAGDPGFAFGAVEDQGVDARALAELHMAGEGGAAQTDQAAVAQPGQRRVATGALGIERGVFHPALLAIGFDDDAARLQPRGVRHRVAPEVDHRAGGGGVHRSAEHAFGLADALPLEHFLADLDDAACAGAGALAQGHDKPRG